MWSRTQDPVLLAETKYGVPLGGMKLLDKKQMSKLLNKK